MLLDLTLHPLAAAFLDVGVYVALFAAAAAWVRWRTGDRLQQALRRRRRQGPVVGALLGVSPGCGGAVLVVPMYVRGDVSFGTVVAALTATMGDSSWVIMAGDPLTALMLHGVLLVTGLLTGLAVDALGIDPRRVLSPPFAADLVELPVERQHPVGPSASSASVVLAPSAPALRSLGPVATSFWVATGAGAGIGVPVSFQLLDPAALAGATGGLDVPLLLGAVGGLLCLALFVRTGCRLADDDASGCSEWSPSLAQGLRHAADETSFVVVWVTVAYAALALVEGTIGLPLESLPLAGLAGVVIGAVVGLVPGCGLQIAFTGAFLAGGVPLPTLVANAVAQDGDALLPLLALDRRAAITASVLTTVPALAVGAVVLALV